MAQKRNRKCFIRKTCIELTFRTEEGLPLPATPYIRLIVESIFAAAQSRYSVTICHFVVMANHIHMLIVVEYPEVIDDFVGYIKRELAHAINRFLGRRKRTVWCEGYDSPVILDPEKVIDRIVYMLTNPQRAKLVERIEDYPNVTSWEALISGPIERTRRRIARDDIPKLPGRILSLNEQEKLAEQLESLGRDENTLFIDPDAWMNCFPELDDISREDVNSEILCRIRAEEQNLQKCRTSPVIGAHSLKLQAMQQPFTPKKFGKRMICLASTRQRRIPFLSWFHDFSLVAEEAIKTWREGNPWSRPPPGFFAPGGMLFSNLNPPFVPLGY